MLNIFLSNRLKYHRNVMPVSLFLTMCLLISSGCKNSILEPPRGSFEIQDSMGEWYPSKSIVYGERAQLGINTSNGVNSISVSVHFYSLVGDEGSFHLRFLSKEIIKNIPPNLFDSDSISEFESVYSSLTREVNDNNYHWSTEIASEVKLQIDDIIEFDNEFYASGSLYSNMCNLESRPVCQTVQGTFTNALIRDY